MDKENFIALLKRKKKLITAAILLVLGLNIALYSHIASVKKAELARMTQEKAEAEKKTADSLAVVRKKQEEHSRAWEKEKKKAEQETLIYRAWLKQLKSSEIEVIEEFPIIDSITDPAAQKVYIDLNEYYGNDAPRDTIDIGYHYPIVNSYDYYLYDEQNGTLSPKLKLKKAYEELFDIHYFKAAAKPHAGHFTVGIESGSKFTPYKLKAEDLSDSLKTKILRSIIPHDIKFSFKTVQKIGQEKGILRIFLSNADAGYYNRLPVEYDEQYHFTDLIAVVDYNLETEQSRIQFVHFNISEERIVSYARFSSDGRANVVYFADYGLTGIYCLRNGRWKKYSIAVPLA